MILNGTSPGRARVVVGSVPSTDPYAVYFTTEWTGLVSNALGTVKNELQGATGYPFLALGLAGQTSGFNGKLGALYDWWTARQDLGPAITYGIYQFISIGAVNANGLGNCGGAWPWDGSTVPITN